MKIVIATSNKHKVKEIEKILKIKGLKLFALSDFPQKIKIVENGKTFKENAVIKAVKAAKKLKMIAIADDSGLCVDALQGRPGVRSARYVRPPVTAERLCKKLLKEMRNVPLSKRTARFVCCVAISTLGGRSVTVEGKCEGTISDKMHGDKGFGYDPVFIPQGLKKTFAQMTTAQKNKISHRGKALFLCKNEINRIST